MIYEAGDNQGGDQLGAGLVEHPMVLADDVKLNEGPSTAQRLKIAEICVLIDVPHNDAARIHALSFEEIQQLPANIPPWDLEADRARSVSCNGGAGAPRRPRHCPCALLLRTFHDGPADRGLQQACADPGSIRPLRDLGDQPVRELVDALVRDDHWMAEFDIEAGRGDNLQPRGLTDAPQAGKIAAPRLHRHLDDRICAQNADVRKLLDRDCDIVKDHEPLRASWSLQPLLAATALVAEDVLVHVGDAKRLGLDGPGNRLNM